MSVNMKQNRTEETDKSTKEQETSRLPVMEKTECHKEMKT